MIYRYSSKETIRSGNYSNGLENIEPDFPLFPRLLNVDISETEYNNKKRAIISNDGLIKLVYDIYDYGDSLDIVKRQGILSVIIKIILFFAYLVLAISLIQSGENFFQEGYKYLLVFSMIFIFFFYFFLVEREYQRLLAAFYTKDKLANRYWIRNEGRKSLKNILLDSMVIRKNVIYEDADEGQIESAKEYTSVNNNKDIVYKLGKAIVAITALFVIGNIVALFKLDYTPKKVLLGLGFSQIPILAYSLVFRDYVSFDDTRKRPNNGLCIDMVGVPFILLAITSFIVVLKLSIIAQVYRGLKIIVVVYLVILAVFLLLGFIRFHNKPNWKRQIGGYILFATLLGYCAVGTFFYGTSSVSEHVHCDYVSKHLGSGRTTSYYVTVKLWDGSEYECEVDRHTYDGAETERLVSCHRYGKLGIEYMRVHLESQISGK